MGGGRWRALTTGGAVVGCWYGGHLLFSIGMKHSVACVADVARLTTAQVGLGAAVLSAGYGLRLIPAVPRWLWWQGTPQGLLFLAGSLCTNASLTLLAVSFAYLLKAIEPFFTMALVWLVDGKPPGVLQFFSLVLASTGLMLTGCAQHAMHTASRRADAPDADPTAGEYAGVVLALLSNLLLQLRNVLNKQLLRPPPAPDLKSRSISIVSLDACEADSPPRSVSPFPDDNPAPLCPAAAPRLTVAPSAQELLLHPSPEAASSPTIPQPLQVLLVSFVSAAAAQLLLDTLSHSAFYPSDLAAALGVTSRPVSPSTAAQCTGSRQASFWVLATPACFLLYQVASILVLGEVEPVVHAALNSLKRALVVVASAMIMHEPVSAEYLVGGAATLIGVSALSSAAKLAKPSAHASAAARRLCCLLLVTQLAVLFTAARLWVGTQGLAPATSHVHEPTRLARPPRNATRAAVPRTSEADETGRRKRRPPTPVNASRLLYGTGPNATWPPLAAPRPAEPLQRDEDRALGQGAARPVEVAGVGGAGQAGVATAGHATPKGGATEGGTHPVGASLSGDAARPRLAPEAARPTHAAQPAGAHARGARDAGPSRAAEGQREGRGPRAEAAADRGADAGTHAGLHRRLRQSMRDAGPAAAILMARERVQ
jgi:drug/metabolite transporter (DMT)-like permease